MAPGALMSHDRRVDHTAAVTFADGWAMAWNSHDLDGILSQRQGHGTYLGSDANPAGVTAR
jgi:hypothetical protein